MMIGSRNSSPVTFDLLRRATAEAIGTCFLLMAVVGSGIMGERLSGGNVAVTLLANSIATGAALIFLILAFQFSSGAHLNPVVTLAEAMLGSMSFRNVPIYIGAQVGGAVAGTALANVMFSLPPLFASHRIRSGTPQLLSEFIATFGLVLIIRSVSGSRPDAVPYAVGAYIASAYWFTSSTSFANPAVTIARSATDTFTGIRPIDVGPFILVQLAGALAAIVVCRWLLERVQEIEGERGE